jgi:Polysaccharide lyase
MELMRKRALFLALLWTSSCAPCSAVEHNWFDALPSAAQADILWKETHESATLGENGKVGSWDGGGEPWASGSYSYAVVDSPTHSGRRAVRTTIDTSDDQSGVRWAMRDLPGDNSTTLPDEAYYSAWVYFPEVFDSEWYMLMQWKTESSYDGSDPVKSVNLEKEDDGRLHLALYDFVGDNGECNGGGSGMKGISPVVFPTGQWVHLESFYKWDKNLGGSVRVWQDGVEVLRQENTRTQYPYNYGTMPRQWAVNAYGDKLAPNPHTMFLDDAAISKSRLSTAIGVSRNQPD